MQIFVVIRKSSNSIKIINRTVGFNHGLTTYLVEFKYEGSFNTLILLDKNYQFLKKVANGATGIRMYCGIGSLRFC